MGMYDGEQGEGQSWVDTVPMPRKEAVRTSSRLARASEKRRWVGAYMPAPKRLSRKTAPSGSDEVPPGMVLRMVDAAGTGGQYTVCALMPDAGGKRTSET